MFGDADDTAASFCDTFLMLMQMRMRVLMTEQNFDLRQCGQATAT